MNAVYVDKQLETAKWMQKRQSQEQWAQVGHVLLFTIQDMEWFEWLAHKVGAEKLMRNYIAFVEKEPRNVHSMFNEYVLDHYPQAKDSTGLTHETVDRILKAVEAEIERRNALRPT